MENTPRTTAPALMTEKQFAALTGLSRNTLRAWRCRRVGPPALKLMGAIRYGADALAWIEDGRRRDLSDSALTAA